MLTDILKQLKDEFMYGCNKAVLQKYHNKLQNEYNKIAKRIIKAQRRLRKKDPENSLLYMVKIDGIIQWTKEFEDRYGDTSNYRGISNEEMFNQYIKDLEKEFLENVD